MHPCLQVYIDAKGRKLWGQQAYVTYKREKGELGGGSSGTAGGGAGGVRGGGVRKRKAGGGGRKRKSGGGGSKRARKK
jgi:hypothetical protein